MTFDHICQFFAGVDANDPHLVYFVPINTQHTDLPDVEWLREWTPTSVFVQTMHVDRVPGSLVYVIRFASAIAVI
jgi:hypothetical protein